MTLPHVPSVSQPECVLEPLVWNSMCARRTKYLHSQGLNVVCAVRPPGEIRQIELNLVPAVVQPHGHGADERLDAGGALVVTRAKPPADVFVIQYLQHAEEGHTATVSTFSGSGKSLRQESEPSQPGSQGQTPGIINRPETGHSCSQRARK